MTLRPIALALVVAFALSSSSAVASPPESASQPDTSATRSSKPSPFGLLKFMVVSSAEQAALDTDDAIWSRIVRFILSEDSLVVSSGPTIRRADGQIRIQLSLQVKMADGEKRENLGQQEIDVSRPIR